MTSIKIGNTSDYAMNATMLSDPDSYRRFNADKQDSGLEESNKTPVIADLEAGIDSNEDVFFFVDGKSRDHRKAKDDGKGKHDGKDDVGVGKMDYYEYYGV